MNELLTFASTALAGPYDLAGTTSDDDSQRAALDVLRSLWELLVERFFFLPPFPETLEPIAIFSSLLISGLMIGEFVHRKTGIPRLVGYVLAGTIFGPSGLGFFSVFSVEQIRPVADAALGILMLEVGRRLDLQWLRRNPSLIKVGILELTYTFAVIFVFALTVVDLSPAWSAATAAVTMASAPAVVLLTVEESGAEGQVTERIVLHTAMGSAMSFIIFALVLGIVHAEHSANWANALVHPLWVMIGALLLGRAGCAIALRVSAQLQKRSLAQVFVLVSTALLLVGLARMLAIPVFLTLFTMGVMLGTYDKQQTLTYTELPEAHWLLAIVLFVVVGASLPWASFTWLIAIQAIILLVVRAIAKTGILLWKAKGLPHRKRALVGMGIQPLSATAVFMAYELANLYPEIGHAALTLPLFAAAIMELFGPLLCLKALRLSGETNQSQQSRKRGGLE